MNNHTINIYIIRHGKSVANEEGILCGQLDTPLSKKGRQQTLMIKDKINSYLRNSSSFQVYCSPLQRCKNTAKLLGYDEDKYSLDSRLMETNTGKFSHEKTNMFKSTNPVYKFEGKNFYTKYPGGESCSDVSARMKSFISEHVYESRKEILIFGHGVTVNHFVHILGNIQYRFYPFLNIDNSSLIHIKYKPAEEFCCVQKVITP